MIPMLPMLSKAGLYAIAIGSVLGAVFVGGCNYGTAKGEAQLQEERAAFAVAAAKAEKRARELESKMQEHAREGLVQHGKDMLVYRTDSERRQQRLRDALATARIVPDAARDPGGCPVCPRCATAAELHRVGEGLNRIIDQAHSERALLSLCATSFPEMKE